ncbi:MAG: putative lipopolysaccharide heptosyltransferase III [Deltaproteobacteria bacterium]|nr:putative lipopolysaccharide heptosyltransferase III [Deltaproteobacteria bacterium]MBW2129869.1 putative lipopolysaccharide heptosyltransferase III [Deltaproteobacteria bacterium]MBW2303106.1 putative lipopolysaccharide heptosyltransferase III [Deltaproteobacteria bacterium]
MHQPLLKATKILIIKLRYIGDTLTLYPVIHTLYKEAPGIRVDVMIHKGTEEVLAHHPGIGRLWLYDRKKVKNSLISSIRYHIKLLKQLRSEKYDLVIDYSHGDRAAFLSLMTGAPERVTYTRSSRLSRLFMNRMIQADPFRYHIVDYQLLALRLLGIERFERTMGIVIPAHVEKRVEVLIKGSGLSPEGLKAAAIHPGARGRLRQWRPERFAEIARRLRESYGVKIFLIGGPDEEGIVREVERHMGFSPAFSSTRLTLLEMAALFKRCRLFVGNDSAPAHIASAVDCPSVTLFGPTFPHMWRPYSPVGEVIFKNPPCCGCRQVKCVRPDNPCMDLIQVDEVWRKIKGLLELF